MIAERPAPLCYPAEIIEADTRLKENFVRGERFTRAMAWFVLHHFGRHGGSTNSSRAVLAKSRS